MTVRLEVDGRPARVADGGTVLDAARGSGIVIPTLCHLDDGESPHASCQVCVVEEGTSGRLLLACATRAEEGMRVVTASEAVIIRRRLALELLLGEHAGECEAPCWRACPAAVDVPRLLRHLAAGRGREAAATLGERLALPASIGLVCSAPCERACRRGMLDHPVALADLHRRAAGGGPRGPCASPTGGRVVVVGAGPAGLSAACFLTLAGHACTVLDERGEPGGGLRFGTPVSRLPRWVLEAEVNDLRALGVVLGLGVRVGRDLPWTALRATFDAVILATGGVPHRAVEELALEVGEGSVLVDRLTLATSRERVFAVGGAVRAGRMAARSAGQGRAVAVAVDQALRGLEVTGEPHPVEVRLGALDEGEVGELAARAEAVSAGLGDEPGAVEAARCLGCACLKSDTCRLRRFATDYGAEPRRFRPRPRHRVQSALDGGRLLLDPGRCIRCGVCVRLTRRADVRPGLAFVGRGDATHVGVPFGASLSEGLGSSAAACVAACPTGALGWRDPDGEESP